MNNDEMVERNISIDDLISAFEDVIEAREELRERQSEYTGYSPSWALASWIESEAKAKEKLAERLSAYIRQEIANAGR